MKKTYIVPEHKSLSIPGGFSSISKKNFLGGDIISVKDDINIFNEDIIWYERSNKEQLNFSIESSYESKIYSPSDNKLKHSRLFLDSKQSDYQKERNAKWFLEVRTKDILNDYLFSTLKNHRTFEGLTNKMSLYNNVDLTIKDYINKNIINFYTLEEVNVYVQYKTLSENNEKRFSVSWNKNINKENKLDKFQIEENRNQTGILISFEQWSSSIYNFEYYYDLKFKIK